MDLIEENLYKKENTFFYNLNEEQKFEEPKFYELMVFIKHLSDKISDTDRPLKANQIWELCFHIQRELTYHCNKSDLVEIKPITESEIASIGNIMFYVANFFTYKKEIEINFIPLDNW